MVRSKFPGKPSKIVTRKIVNSRKYSVQQDNESTKAAENISYGLAVFNEAFGNHEQVLTAFHGFSPHEIEKAREITRNQQDKVTQEYLANGLNHSPEDAIPVKLDHPSPEALSLVAITFDSIGPVGQHTTRAQCQKLSNRSGFDFSKSISPSKFFSPLKGSVQKHVASRLLQKAKKSAVDLSPVSQPSEDISELEQGASAGGAVRKFVLPSRSARSSRVIKPNKRFIDSEENSSDKPTQHQSLSAQPLRTRTIELKKPRLILNEDNDFLVLKSESVKFGMSDKYDSSFGAFKDSVKSATTAVQNKGEGRSSLKHVKLGDLNVFGAPTTRSSSCGSENEDESLFPSNLLCPPLGKQSIESALHSKTKSILRESKLNISLSQEKPPDTSYSHKPKKGYNKKTTKSPGTHVECGVCGAVYLCRFMKQAHKFGIDSCELCRKFIARMMIKARSADNSVHCEKGQGNCINASAMPISDGVATKANRCRACWLVMCLQRFVKMPEPMRDSLIRMLPANMQGMTVVLSPLPVVCKSLSSRNRQKISQAKGMSQEVTPSSSQSPVTSLKNQASPSKSRIPQVTTPSKRVSQTPVGRIRRKAAMVSLANNLRRVREISTTPGMSQGSSFRKCGTEERKQISSKSKKRKGEKRSIFVPNVAEKTLRKISSKNLQKGKDGAVRQKLSLKGPRVKHVCRSASVVLGQPLATFPIKAPGTTPSACNTPPSPSPNVLPSTTPNASDTISELDREMSKYLDDSKDTTDIQSKVELRTVSVSLTRMDAPRQRDKTHLSHVNGRGTCSNIDSEVKLSSKCIPTFQNQGRKVTRLPPNSAALHSGFKRGQRRTLQSLGVYSTSSDPLPHLISLDFWESYDPDEVCNTGFGLIGLEPFGIKPVCFLCGSAGNKKLIHCASCCEPYHQFCVEIGVLGGTIPSVDSSGRDEWRVDWVCPRCTVCHSCGRGTGHQLTSCQRCHHSYHLDCLGSSAFRKSAADRPWICSSCLRCKSCNSAEVTKFVGNLPFCKVCFKLRQKGNFCPLCQGCYEDDDYQSKMMECADCKSWVHAKCEGLSDEKYQVLSYLPESVEFICRLCCDRPPASWWLAVEAELQAGYNNIIKAITKNRKTCALLRWSPKKICECQSSSASEITKCPAALLLGKRRLSFSSSVKVQIPPADLKTVSSRFLSDDGGVLSLTSVFEFDDDIDAGENTPIAKYIPSKEKNRSETVARGHQEARLGNGSDSVENQGKGAQYSPNAGSQSDSGLGSTDDELKACSAAEEEDVYDSKDARGSSGECICSSSEVRNISPSLLSVKRKVQTNEYSSLLEFHRDMDQLVKEADSQEVKEFYHQMLQDVFPWFDPKYTRVSRNFFCPSPCKPSYGSLLHYQPNKSSPEKSDVNLSSKEILETVVPRNLNDMGDSYYYSGMAFVDGRVCGFCKVSGDSDATEEGRLLYCGQNEWVHVNCALWSAEVFEEVDGALQNVNTALSRGRMIRCRGCGKKGASIGCCAKKCEETLHFRCARSDGFVFMEDKNAYCPVHKKDAPGKPITKESDFDVCRPVYVELDRRKKKNVESKHVRVSIGSLSVENIGMIIPELSDQGSLIIPTQFSCTRLYWSSKEPWRLVRYTIRTSVKLPMPEPILDVGHHVTVDHSKEEMENESKLGEIRSSEHCSTESPKSCLPTRADDSKVVEAVLCQILDTVCSKEAKEADEEVSDPQNAADLLPPELKDAIFEDLPHDLLDGISMQDIFQDKFLNFEDLNREEGAEEVGDGEPSRGQTVPGGSKRQDSSAFACCSKSKDSKNVKVRRELKRSKSDVMPSIASEAFNRLHQRSCSLAWSCKLGTSISRCKSARRHPVEGSVDRAQFIQELHLSVKPAPAVDMKYHFQASGDKGKENHSLKWPRIMQVDGQRDTPSSGSETGSDIEVVDPKLGCSKTLTSRASEVTSRKFVTKDPDHLRKKLEELRKVTSAALLKSPVYLQSMNLRKKLQTDCLDQQSSKWRKVSKKHKETLQSKIPQVDGTNDFSSDSDHDGAVEQESKHQVEDKPVRCNRCRCTYRTEESYSRHLPNCSGDYSLTTSESEADVSDDEAVGNQEAHKGTDQISSQSPDSAISVSSECRAPASPTPVVAPVPPVNPTSTANSVLTSTAALVSQPKSIPRTTSVTAATLKTEQILTKSMPGHVTGPAKVQQKILTNKMRVARVPHQPTSKAMTKRNQPVVQPQRIYEHSNQQIVQQTLQQSLQQSIQQAQPSQQQSQVIAMIDYQQSQQSAPTVLVQSVPSSAMVPAYVEAFQQYTGQNLQYVATMDTSGGFGKAQYLTAVPSTVMPGAFHLQALPEGQLCLESSALGLSTIPGLQIAQAQPQMLGTLIQSQLPCGVVATTEPAYETIQMYPDQTGGVLLTSQPMLTCMETVVSNTYMSMSSSQFVSSPVPDMLQGSSSFSTTTTQVFQASKVDPPMMEVPTQYVVVNPHASLTDQNHAKMELVSVSQPHIKEPSPPQVSIQSINLPSAVTLPAPLPPQTLPPVIPTSIVPPMPRVHPQRTYSKLTKNGKEVNVLTPCKSTAASSNETDGMAAVSNSTKQAEKINVIEMSIVAESKVEDNGDKWQTKGRHVLHGSSLPIKKASQSVVIGVAAQPELTSNPAPAQSITLPDPITCKLPPKEKAISCAPSSTSVIGTSTSASGKCPPVTFSYRSHVVTKSKPKQLCLSAAKVTPNLIKSADTSVMMASSSKCSSAKLVTSNGQPLLIVTPTSNVNNLKHVTQPSALLPVSTSTPTASVKTEPVNMQSSVASTVASVNCSAPVVSCAKPVATIVPQTQVAQSELSTQVRSPQPCQKVSCLPASSVKSSSTSTLSSPMGSLKCRTMFSCSSNSTPKAPFVTNTAPTNVLSVNMSPAVSSRSLSAPCVPTSSSLGGAPTSITVISTTSDVSPTVTTNRPLISTVTGLKPIHELKGKAISAETKGAFTESQEKNSAVVPPAVLKSFSPNVDTNKKNESVRKQSEIPVVFSADKSPTSLKLLFQKQAHSGCYKVTSPGKKEGDLLAVKLGDTGVISSNLKEKKGGKDESENVEPASLSSSTSPQIIYEIHCQDGFSCKSSSISDAWQKVFGAVQEARANHKMPPLLHNPFGAPETAANVLGLGNNSLKYLLEQLPGVGNCSKYRPVYHKSRLPGSGYQYKREDYDSLPKESRSGCARTDPYLSPKRYDMFSWLDSRHRRPPKLLENTDCDSLLGSRRATSVNLPMAMRFRHLRETSKTSVGVFRSDIHGRGLFCLRDIEAGEMVIEYAGEVIRNTLTDNRERYYQSKGIGCYMFKVDDNFTVDATRKGNAARFINHSCEPNCYSRVVDILGKKHIIIFAFRRIPQGEELTYDYKFPIEDEKIHCHCLARRCRKYLN